MKWMGWGWNQLMEAPDVVVDEIITLMKEEADDLENH